MSDDREYQAALLEAVLFLETEARDESALARITGMDIQDVQAALMRLREDCLGESRGIEPILSGGGWILAPKTNLWESLRERYGRKSETRLSSAAMQTLSIIAYSQPITRSEIEALRGVSAETMIRLLQDRGFIEDVGRKETPGRPIQYGTTKEFLRYFRLGSIADLPKLGEMEKERFDPVEEGDD